MEYAEFIDSNIEETLNQNYGRNVGYTDTNSLFKTNYYNINIVNTISKKLTELLQGVDPLNRPIIIPDNTIINIMDSVQQNYRPLTGDIFSRYNIPNGQNSDDYISSMIDQTIEIIYSEVKNNFEIEENNKNLSVWTTLLGDFNEQGLRSVPPIKILNKHPAHCQFNMNY
jgi:hypothetical protein